MPREKPPKPYVDFPLYAHANGQWAKKIRGKTRFFGAWNDWRAALKEYELTRDIDPTPDALDLDDLVNLFLGARKKDVEAGEIKMDTWKEYRRACAMCLDILGRTVLVEDLRTSHFVALRQQLAKEIQQPATLRNVLVKLRVLFKWAYDSDHCEQPLRYRDALKRPPVRLLREARNASQKKLYTHKEVCALLAVNAPWMKAAIYLGINGGFGNRDICEIRWTDIQGDWLIMAREKTAINRRVHLWPETLKALTAIKTDSPWVFCGERGQQLGQGESNATPIGALFRKHLTAAGIDVKDGKPVTSGRGFYTLRHTYRTIADGAKDRGAVRFTMGHADGSIDDAYIEDIADERLMAVSAIVRKWLKQNAQC